MEAAKVVLGPQAPLYVALLLRAVDLIAADTSTSSGCSASGGTNSLSPILIIPGFRASQLESRDVASWSAECTLCLCYSEEWKTLWINAYWFLFCGSDALRHLTLDYDPATDSYANASGVEVRAPGFGETGSVENLANDFLQTFTDMVNAFEDMVDYFEDRGYEVGKTIRAAPYDWRLAADQLEARGYYTALRLLAEEMHRDSGEKVTVVAHSMGGPVALHFLTSVVDQEWKDKHINAFFALSGSWAGSGKALMNVVSGLNPNLMPVYHIFTMIGHEQMLTFVRSLQTTYWLLPRPAAWGNTVLVSTPSKNYTTNQYKELFTDIGFPEGYTKYIGISDINDGYPAPNVPVYCLYGSGIPTPQSFVYGSTFPWDHPDTILMGEGDDTINLVSARLCLKWGKEQSQRFYTQEFPGLSHTGILKSEAIFKQIEAVTCLKNSTENSQPNKHLNSILFEDVMNNMCFEGQG